MQRANDGNSNWPGQSRIIRYELSKYSDLATLTTRSGYRDPTTPDDNLASFEVWQNGGTPAGSSAVLVDYVQTPTPPQPLNRSPLSDAGRFVGVMAWIQIPISFTQWFQSLQHKQSITVFLPVFAVL